MVLCLWMELCLFGSVYIKHVEELEMQRMGSIGIISVNSELDQNLD